MRDEFSALIRETAHELGLSEKLDPEPAPLALLDYKAELDLKNASLRAWWNHHAIPDKPGLVVGSPLPRHYRSTSKRRLIRKGETVEMGIGSANRQESVYGDPAEFRLDRPDPRQHLAFGAGSHVCPGAMLARLEGATAVRVLLDRAKALRRVEGVRYPPLPGSLGHQPIPARLVPR